MRCRLPQILGRSSVVLHFEENKAAQTARLLVIGVYVQHFLDEFQGLIQTVLGQVIFCRREQRPRLGGCKPNKIPRAGFGILGTIHTDCRMEHLLEAVPVIGLHVEHCLRVLDCLLEPPEPQQDIRPEAEATGLIAAESDGSIDGGEGFSEPLLHAIRMCEPILEACVVEAFRGSFPPRPDGRLGVARVH